MKRAPAPDARIEALITRISELETIIESLTKTNNFKDLMIASMRVTKASIEEQNEKLRRRCAALEESTAIIRRN